LTLAPVNGRADPAVLQFDQVLTVIIPTNNTRAFAILDGDLPQTVFADTALFTEGSFPPEQQVVIYDHGYGFSTKPNYGYDQPVNIGEPKGSNPSSDIPSNPGNWPCANTHYVSLQGGDQPVSAGLPFTPEHVIRHVRGTCRIDLPFAPLLTSIVRQAIEGVQKNLPGGAHMDFFQTAQPQFSSRWSNIQSGFMLEGLYNFYSDFLGINVAGLSIDPAFSFTISPDGFLQVKDLELNAYGEDLNIRAWADHSDFPGALIPTPESIVYKAQQQIDPIPMTLQDKLNTALTVRVDKILRPGLGSCQTPSPSAPSPECSKFSAALSLLGRVPSGVLGPSNFNCVKNVPNDGNPPNQCGMAGCECGFHPTIQAVNVLPDKLEFVLSPNLANQSSPDNLTTFYSNFLPTNLPGLQSKTSNIGGRLTLSADVDCSTLPIDPGSGTITTLFRGNKDLVPSNGPGLQCHEIAQTYWLDNDLTQPPDMQPGPAGPVPIPQPFKETSGGQQLFLPGHMLDGYWQASVNQQHVNYLDGNRHIHELLRNNTKAGANQDWIDTDLTTTSGGITCADNGGTSSCITPSEVLDGYWQNTDPQNTDQHVNFIALEFGGGFHVHELRYRPPGPNWSETDLFKIPTACRRTFPEQHDHPPSFNSGLDGYWQNSNNSQHVNYVDRKRNVNELLFRNGTGETCWEYTNLTMNSGNKSLASSGSPLYGYSQNADQHVYFFASDLHIHELIYGPTRGPNWKDNDLFTTVGGACPTTTNAPTPSVLSDLHAYWQQSDNSQHVNYIDGQGDVQELLFRNGTGGACWENTDLTKNSGTTSTAQLGSALNAYWQQSDDTQHVNFVDDSGHIHELIFHSGKGQTNWADSDLTQLSGGPPATPGSALIGYWESSDNTQHVDFIDKQGNVQELYFGQ
jgi:hypothetical protein